VTRPLGSLGVQIRAGKAGSFCEPGVCPFADLAFSCPAMVLNKVASTAPQRREHLLHLRDAVELLSQVGRRMSSYSSPWAVQDMSDAVQQLPLQEWRQYLESAHGIYLTGEGGERPVQPTSDNRPVTYPIKFGRRLPRNSVSKIGSADMLVSPFEDLPEEYIEKAVLRNWFYATIPTSNRFECLKVDDLMVDDTELTEGLRAATAVQPVVAHSSVTGVRKIRRVDQQQTAPLAGTGAGAPMVINARPVADPHHPDAPPAPFILGAIGWAVDAGVNIADDDDTRSCFILTTGQRASP
jgi:hypothetical protein